MGLVLICCYNTNIHIYTLVMHVWINVEFGKAEGAVNTTKQRVLNYFYVESFLLQS